LDFGGTWEHKLVELAFNKLFFQLVVLVKFVLQFVIQFVFVKFQLLLVKFQLVLVQFFSFKPQLKDRIVIFR